MVLSCAHVEVDFLHWQPYNIASTVTVCIASKLAIAGAVFSWNGQTRGQCKRRAKYLCTKYKTGPPLSTWMHVPCHASLG